MHLIVVWGDAMDISASATKDDMDQANLDNFMIFLYAVSPLCHHAANTCTRHHDTRGEIDLDAIQT